MKFQIGDVVNRTFGASSRNFMPFFMLALLLSGLPALALGVGMQQAVEAGSTAAIGWTTLAYFFVGTITATLLQGAIVHGAVADFNGRKASFGESLNVGLRHILPLIAIGILVSLGVMLGMLLLVVPGIILALMWAVAVPARVVENLGISEAMGRSRELTKGNRWSILLLFVLYGVTVSVVSFIFAMPAAFGGPGATMFGVFLDAVATTLTAIVSSVGVSALYFELRKAKEGIGPEELARVFD